MRTQESGLRSVEAIRIERSPSQHGKDVWVIEEVWGRLSLVPFAAPQEGSVVEHVDGARVERPVVALARVARLPWHLDEAIVEAEVVSDGVLPGGELGLVVREPGHDEVTDLTQSHSLLVRLQDGHGDEGDVRVRRLH